MKADPGNSGGGWRGRARAFLAAGRGLGRLVREEPHARFHLGATVAVIAAGVICRLAVGEWCAVVAAVALVWTAEALNAAIERAVDLASPDVHPLAAAAKDFAAAAVLAAAAGAAAVGLAVFSPKVAGWLAEF